MDPPDRLEELLDAVAAVIMDGEGRSGGSVFLVHREQWVALRAALEDATEGQWIYRFSQKHRP